MNRFRMTAASAVLVIIGLGMLISCAHVVPLRYQVVYSGNDHTAGNVPDDPLTYLPGDQAVVMNHDGSLQRRGHTFIGWNTRADGTGKDYVPGELIIMESQDITLHAVWDVNQYQVQWDGNTADFGDEPQTAELEYQVRIIMPGPGDLVKEGFSFIGWNTRADGTGEGFLPGETFAVPDAEVTLYAQWEPATYQLAYDGNTHTAGAPPGRVSAEHLTALEIAGHDNLDKRGHTFAGWNTRRDGTGDWYQSGSSFVMGTSDAVLYAQWEVNRYQVSWEGNTADAGSPPAEMTRDYGSILEVPGPMDLSRRGHTFAGWNTREDGGGDAYHPQQDFTVPDRDVIFYAQWEVKRYQVSWEGNTADAGSPPAEMTRDYGSILEVPGPMDLSRRGHTFAGWNTREDGGGDAYHPQQEFTVPDRDVVFYAQWEVNWYLVTYHDMGATSGDVPEPREAPYGSELAVSGAGSLEKRGHTFAGWNTREDLQGETFSPGDILILDDADADLYAVWEVLQFTISFAASEDVAGDPPDAFTADYGSSVQVPGQGDMNLTGHNFIGWNTQEDGSGDSYAPDDELLVPDDSLTLYAQWDVIRINVSYMGGGHTAGPVPEPVTAVYGELIEVPHHGRMQKEGQGFAGWNTREDGSGTPAAPGDVLTAADDDITLYAQWIPFTMGGPGQAGGIIFYIDEAEEFSWTYLEAAPWDIDSLPWGGYGETVGGTSDELGSGMENTLRLVEALPDEHHAARASYDWVFNGYDDWFLPSRHELDVMEKHLHAMGLGSFRDSSRYWSSSENSATNAWRIGFGTGRHFSNFKFSSSPVRPVRAF